MKSFRHYINESHLNFCLENKLNRANQQVVQRLYDATTKLLLGAAKDQLNVPLSDIEDDTGSDGKPPTNKGPKVALEKLSNAQIFQKLQAIGDPELAARANQAQNWLQKIANDQTVGPKDTVGGLLDQMFGHGSAQTYGNHTWKSTASTPTQQPQNNQVPGDTATSAPMAQQLAPPPPAAGGAPMPPPPAGGAAPMPDPNAPPVDPAMGQAPPQPDPNDPATPPTTPNGPLPPKPPGGLTMA
jgi:hypothetical protein